jgi:hypothetical protein
MSYDPRAVKIGKQVKRIASTILDQNHRRDFIRGFVKAEETIMRTRSSRNKGDRADG